MPLILSLNEDKKSSAEKRETSGWRSARRRPSRASKVCAYVHTYVWLYACVHVCMYACVCAYSHTYVWLYALWYANLAFMHIHVCRCIYVLCMYIYVCMYMYVRMHIILYMYV